MESIKLGSMYFDSKPYPIPRKYNKGALSIRNTVKGKEISWVNVNGLLVADHTICTNISWNNLNQQGFIFGKKVTIDGNWYLCRSLKVGSDENEPNEWDDILDVTGADNSLWHWNAAVFWGQETLKLNEAYRATRGFTSARLWGDYLASHRNEYVGFRPALEPLVFHPLISDSLVGTTINVYGSDGDISGVLCGFTDYDLFLSPVADNVQISDYPWCCQQEDGTIIINRSAVAISRRHLMQ